ncbi:MAG: hypothetical protein FWE22_01180 [Firmicutes bacterium]|nr:hypothetical protein [Bacillota bacterium]
MGKVYESDFALIFGLPGVGKTAFMTALIIEAMTKKKAESLYQSRKIVAQMNKGGFKFTMPDNHLVYADYKVKTLREESHDLNLQTLGLPSKNNPNAQILPPAAFLFIDEGQNVFDSRKRMSRALSYFFELRRHNDLSIYIACQRSKLIDLNVRELVSKIYEIVKMTHKYDRWGCLKSTTWHYNVFDNCFLVDQYLSSGKTDNKARREKFTFKGNVFKFYNHQHGRPAFYNGAYDRDFDLPKKKSFEEIRKKPVVDLSVEGMKKYNELHIFHEEEKEDDRNIQNGNRKQHERKSDN